MLLSEFAIYSCGFLSPRVHIRNSTLAFFFIPEVEYDSVKSCGLTSDK